MLAIFQLYLAKDETGKASFIGSEENVDEITTTTENGSFESEGS